MLRSRWCSSACRLSAGRCSSACHGIPRTSSESTARVLSLVYCIWSSRLCGPTALMSGKASCESPSSCKSLVIRDQAPRPRSVPRRSGSTRRNCICSCPTCLRKSRTPARGSRVVLSSSLFGCPSYAPLRRLRVCLCRRVAFHVTRPAHGLPRLCAFDLRGLHLLWRTGLDDAATA